MFASIDELKVFLKDKVSIGADGVKIENEEALKKSMRELMENATQLNENEQVRDAARWVIIESGQELGITLASINDLYMARGRKEYSGMSVPAINIRGFTYDMSKAIFRACAKKNNGAVIFELAKSETGYTFQRPAEYTSCIMAAAINEGFRGPLFVQGDHFQFKAKNFREDRDKEIEGMKALIKEAIAGGYFNIDIDSSTLVDLDRPTLDEQQKDNYEMCALMTEFIRENEPDGVTISVGGEIGEVGEKNSTVEELVAYMEGYKKKLEDGVAGISKVSVQTGTSHGGVVLPDGSIANVSIDFETLKELSNAAIDKWGLGGAVQHGASTLPDDAFDKFPQMDTVEVHLATGFQNIIMDSDNFPSDLKDKMYSWMKENLSGERKEGWTDEQFFAKLRKKAWGPFKREILDLQEDTREKLRAELQDKFEFLFDKLGASDSKKLVDEKIKPERVKFQKPAGL